LAHIAGGEHQEPFPRGLISRSLHRPRRREEDAAKRPAHTIYMDAFYMDVYEATNARYAQSVEAGVCTEPSSRSSYTRESYYGDPAYDDYPVGHVNWEQAKIYCDWRGARLPTEAEWEKAARGGLVGKLYPWGHQEPDCSRVNFSGCKGDTVKVGSYPLNGYGLFDMAGNVWEYVWDWYSESYYVDSPSQDPIGLEDGLIRVMRGGSGFEEASFLRAANRGWDIPFSQTAYSGFRCAR
jgi:formylglycine-generating enzyme required for sulfatase activity